MSSFRKHIYCCIFLIFVFAGIAPVEVGAAPACSDIGYTILTINGVFTDKTNAEKNLIALSNVLRIGSLTFLNGEPITVDYLHNESHLAGLGDIFKVIEQGLFDSETIEDYDLVEMLLSASEKVSTQKLLFVAHSQGNFYANSFYDVVADKVGGVPVESLGVYSVATPSGHVAGNGQWLTSDTDKIIAGLVGRTLARPIMSPNTSIALQDGDDSSGHSFSDIYLKYRGAKIISDIQASLAKLQTNNIQSANAPCISPPRITLVHNLTGAFFAVADPMLGTAVDGYVALLDGTYRAMVFAANTFTRAVSLSANTGDSLLGNFGGLTLAIFDKFVTTVGPGQTTVGPRSEEAATSTPSQPDRTAETQAPAPVTASPKAQETVATNPEPSNPTSSPAVAGTSTANPEVNSPVIFGGVSGTPAPTGGISVSGGSPSPGDGGATPNDSTSTGELPPSEPPPSEPPATSTLFAIENFAGEFKSDRLEIDFSWSPSLAPTSSPKYLIKLIDNGTSTVVAETTATSASVPVPGYGKTFTYSIEAQDADGNLLSNIPTADVAVPDWFTEIQPAATDESLGSHYSDNWYNLGTDFYGTVYALTLEGGVVGGNNPSVLQDSTVLLQEYLDSNYLTKNREFVISQGQDFTREIKEVMIKNLNIPLQPNKYYRLWTSNGLQNAYVALKGTINPSCDSPCGDAMWNEFISGAAGGQGRTEHVYRFYPFIQAVMQKDFPAQSTPTSPEITSVNFDDIGMRLDVSWASSTDADTTDNLIKYEFNYSTTGELSADGWIEVSGGAKSIALEFPNSYTFGVRAKDDFGNTSAPSVQNWNFPEGFSVYVLSNSVGVADQNFALSGGGNLASVTVFTDGWSSSARFSGGTCTMALYDAENASEAIAQSETSYESTACNGTKTFSFSSAPEILSGHNYFWRFTASTGNPSTDASIKFYGTTVNTAGGLFSNSSIVNARFELTDSGGGTLFKN